MQQAPNSESPQTIAIDDRTLAYAEYGDPDGYPVLYFHGNPGSRYSGGLLADAAIDTGVRLVAPERPGFGKSDPRPGRSIADWADDVARLHDALDIDRFGVVGYSAGGPHALACAQDDRFADDLDAVGLLAGAAPPAAPQEDVDRVNRLLFAAGRTVPWLLGPLFSLQAWVVTRRDPSFVTGIFSDREVGTGSDEIDPAIAEAVKTDFVTAFETSSAGAVREAQLLATPWDSVDLDTVEGPVYCRYGSADRNVPPAQGEFLADRIGVETDLEIVPGADHLTLLLEAGEEVLARIAP